MLSEAFREELAERRHRMLQALGDDVLVLFSAPVQTRNGDVEQAYRQHSDFYYLTGFEEPEAVLVLRAATPSFVLFLRERDREREIWDGRRVGVEAASDVLGVETAHPIDALKTLLPDYLENTSRLHYHFGQHRPWDEVIFSAIASVQGRRRRRVDPPTELIAAGELLHAARRIKSDFEVQKMRKAAELTASAHRTAMKQAQPGMLEHRLASEIEFEFRKGGARREAYESIVGSGDNATILHYRENDRVMQDGDLVLIDAGAELDYYAADITRTFPVGGCFSPPQRRLYDLVLQAHEAAIAKCRPGNTLDHIHDAAFDVISAGLIELGIVEPSLAGDSPDDQATEDPTVDSLPVETCGKTSNSADAPPSVQPTPGPRDAKYYFMHRTSHLLGLDVHDVGKVIHGGEALPLEPGMALTVEPGVYLARDDETVPQEYRGIGIRIEDDVIVTQQEPLVLTSEVPTDPGAIEMLCRAES